MFIRKKENAAVSTTSNIERVRPAQNDTRNGLRGAVSSLLITLLLLFFVSGLSKEKKKKKKKILF